MTKSEMSELRVGDRITRIGPNGEEHGTVVDTTASYVYVQYDTGHPDQPGLIEIADQPHVWREGQ